MWFMELRVKPTPTRFQTNSLYSPMDYKPLHSIPSVSRLLCESFLRALGGGPNE